MLGYSSRFIEDYVFHKTWKIFNRMNVIGFTVNPEYCSGNFYDYFIHLSILRKNSSSNCQVVMITIMMMITMIIMLSVFISMILGVNWSTVIHNNSPHVNSDEVNKRIRVILFVRSNLIKTVISGKFHVKLIFSKSLIATVRFEPFSIRYING